MCGNNQFVDVHDMVVIVNFIVKNGFALGFALELPLNHKKQNVPNALELPLDFSIFTPPTFTGCVVKM